MTASGALRAERVVTPAGSALQRGPDLGRLDVVSDAIVSFTDGVIDFVGPAAGYPGDHRPEPVAGTVVPGFVDCHTHVPFFGWRADEYEARLAGRSYRDQHGEGGIGRSARMLAEASDDDVIAFCRSLLDEMLQTGTTALELKTGYGLSVEAELRQARLARRLSNEARQRCTVTLLACHAVPPNETREGWVDKACTELIPQAAAEGLADAVDIYVEDIAFTVADLERVAAAALSAGLPLRCHVEQLTNSNGAVRAAELGAVSVDHLNHLDPAGVDAVARSEAVAVLLPASTFVLRSDPPPARALIEAGAAVAVASDFNPGTSPVSSLPETIAFACNLYGLNPAQAFAAATVNAAHVLGLGASIGSIEAGKKADLVVLEGELFDVPYRPGHNPVVATYVGGMRTTV